jgi:pyruvate/2-oxoglutarate dehydrogenase complex dihydrolipoamide acyltransferase (E2) component
MARNTMAAVGAVVALCAAAPAAQAHYLTVGEATCTGLSASYAEFSESNKPIDYTVTVDSSPLNVGSFRFPGPSGTLTVTFYAPLATGDHVVTFTSTWHNQGSENGSFQKHVYGCPGPPPAPSPPAPAPASAPAPAPAPAAPAAESAPPAPQSGVLAAHQRSHRRFGTKRTMVCRYGRRQLRDSQGRRFTACLSKPKAVVAIQPKFTG